MCTKGLHCGQGIVERIRPVEVVLDIAEPKVTSFSVFALGDPVGEDAQTRANRELALNRVKVRLRQQTDGQITVSDSCWGVTSIKDWRHVATIDDLQRTIAS